ncbi:hypothetical protein [Mesorhizobium sp. CA7]|uniref:hypothetical protein n=1 Tax=Mesorhizobium sp. CA7 TaxID=588501 RepID=UPI001CCEB031|nr:hypothetical protein [Mesorhizobium sp. CA7]MBZ9816519.1 hypothetical protein [Mesorhizobium sp. CA7]
METLTADITRIESGQPVLNWPECIPAIFRNRLKARHGLKARRQSLLDAYHALVAEDRLAVRNAMARQNELPLLLEDGLPCLRLIDLPASVRAPIKEIFEFAFGLLSDLGLRDQNYQRVYNALQHKVCAFCGVEILDAPGQKREALDHYLSIALYPFAGTNFRNLTPMGNKCNSRYKLQQDIILDALGNRRLCCDPYNSPELTLSLANSRPFEGEQVNLIRCPDWDIQWIGGDPAKLQTWEAAFNISTRYRASSLNPNFRSWMDHFGRWAAQTDRPAGTPADLRDTLREFAETAVPEGWSDSAFLKRATMLMLAHRCDDTEDGQRVIEWLRGLIDTFKETITAAA